MVFLEVEITDKMRNDLHPFAVPDVYDDTSFIRYKGDYIFQIGLDGETGAYHMDIDKNEMFNYYYYWTKKKKNSLYILVPFDITSESSQDFFGKYCYNYSLQVNELYEYAKEKKFLSGLKIFKIMILE